MKILRHNGQKVLEAPIDPKFTYFNNHLVIELRTVDKATPYLLLLNESDIAQLTEIFRSPLDELQRNSGND